MIASLIIWGIGIGIPVAMMIFLLGWLAGFNHFVDVGSWGAGWDSGWNAGWNAGWSCGYDKGYMCGIQDRRKDRKQLKEKDRDAG